MRKPLKQKPIEGHAFSFELDRDSFGMGVLARVETNRPRKPYGIFVYFFAPFAAYDDPKAVLRSLRPGNAIARLKTSALDIYTGEWLVIGPVPNFKREEWPLPDFYEEDWLNHTYWRVRLDESDLAHLTERERIVAPGDLQLNTSHGSLSAVNTVKKLVENLLSAGKSIH
jgi:hypothetical protein